MVAEAPPLSATDDPSSSRVLRLLRGATEVVVLLVVVPAPWLFGGTNPFAELVFSIGIALLLVLWAAVTLCAGRISIPVCVLTLLMTALLLYAGWQLLPLPSGILSRLSPTTVHLQEQMVPEVRETAADGRTLPAPLIPAGSTISLVPHATRQAVIRFAAVLFLFLVVRVVVASPESFRRFSIVMVINAILLALFALIQAFTSPPHLIYWSVPDSGAVFGPYHNRNHFAFYMNLCLGLGLGLMALRMFPSNRRHRHRSGRSHSRTRAHTPEALAPAAGGFSLFLKTPVILWLALGMGVMAASAVFTLSRGGLLALVAATSVSLIVLVLQQRGGSSLLALVGAGAVAGALLVQFGVGALARYGTMLEDGAAWDARLHFWSRSWSWIAAFPLWGTGEGTFSYVENVYLHQITDVGWTWEHAHNEYLEALLEGGIFRLLLHVALVSWAIYLSLQVFFGAGERKADPMALGQVFAWTALAVHSFVEFGLHVESIVLLAAVMLAHLSAAAARSKNEEGTEGENGLVTFRLSGVTATLGAGVALLLAVFLVLEGWKQELTARFLAAVKRVAPIPGEPARLRQINYMQQAARMTPGDAEIQLALAMAYFSAFEEVRTRPQTVAAFADLSTRVALDLATGVPVPNQWPFAVASALAGSRARGVVSSTRIEEAGQGREFILQGLAHCLQARALCPLQPQIHLRLAAYREYLRSPDTVSGYLERTKLMAASDPRLWYLCGLAELEAGRKDVAWRSWHRSLELGDDLLEAILSRAVEHLDGPALLELVLPENPRLIDKAVTLLYPDEGSRERRPFQEKNLRLLEARMPALQGEELYLKATLHRTLDQPEEAARAYDAALGRNPEQAGWRYEYAELLARERKFSEARAELHRIISQYPQHGRARALLEQVALELAKQRK